MHSILVLGLGNRLLGDDAAGPLAIDSLARDRDDGRRPGAVLLQDGGTIGLGLLPAIEKTQGLIAVDAARLGKVPGTVTVLEGEAMDRVLVGRKSSVHEVALADLMAAAALQGALPARRALVAVEPRAVAIALGPTPEVETAIPRMCDAVRNVIDQWMLQDGARP